MNHGSLFSGIGGFDLAAEWMGWNNVFHCEWNPFGQKVLKHYWPNAIQYNDITKTDFTIHRGGIDILTGGFPCQPYSAAGKRKGTEDSRHLWPEMLRAIREIQPTYVVGENVRGLTNWNGGMVFDQVQADLETEGFEVLPFLLPACAVNAPHRRDRIWFVAYTNSDGQHRGNRKHEKQSSKGGKYAQRDIEPSDEYRTTTNSTSKRAWQLTSEDKGRQNRRSNNDGQKWTATNTGDKGLERYDEWNKRPFNWKYERLQFRAENQQPFTDTDSRRQSGKEHRQTQSRQLTEKSFPGDWQNFPTQSPICFGDDGLSTQLDGITFSKWRNESIKAGGNAIVPQVAYQIFKAIDLCNTIYSHR